MGDTSIQWTDKTWNPIRARNIITGEVGWFCEHASHGCDNCYAEKMNINTYFGNGLPYKASSLPQSELFLDEKMLMQPLRWQKRKKVFVCSMTDLFGRFVSDEQIDRIFAVMALSQKHTFQILTKRPERMYNYMQRLSKSINPLESVARELGHTFFYEGFSTLAWPIRNVWLGTSVEDKETYQKRIPHLSQTPASVRFISFEPLLADVGDLMLDGICGGAFQWAIIGGESGKGARRFNLEWAASIINQCHAAHVSVFMKQLGANAWNGARGLSKTKIFDRKGGDMSEWPESFRVRNFPQIQDTATPKAGNHTNR
jgi:protein gp37